MKSLENLSKEELINLKKEYEDNIAYHDNAQYSAKILLNSAYGVLGNQYFRFYDVRLAGAITLTGQFIIRYAIQEVNKQLNKLFKTDKHEYVIASDTDSIYVSLGNIVETKFPTGTFQEKYNFVIKFYETIFSKIITTVLENIQKKTNSPSQLLKMPLESISTNGLWTAKKKYALNTVLNSEEEKTKISIKGLEVIRSNTPLFYRQALKEALLIILTKDEKSLQEFYKKIKSEFKSKPLDEILPTQGANQLEKYSNKITIYNKGCPYTTKAALVYNYYLTEKKLDNKYPLIRDREKVKYLPLKTPNPIGEKLIAYPGKQLPKEFALSKFIDYNKFFISAFETPLFRILDAINWKAEELNTFF